MADCVRHTISSNKSGLWVAEEECPKQLPVSPEWIGLEPNEYDSFGPEVSLTARQPIKSNRKNRKGKPTDLNVAAGFQQDFTHSNSNRLLEGFFFANYHEKPTTKPIHGTALAISGIATSNDRYTLSDGGYERGFRVGHLVIASGCGKAANNGLKLVDEIGDEYIGVAENLADETPPGAAALTVVGFQFASAAVKVVMDGNIPVLTMEAAPVAAEADLTIEASENADPDDTVTIGNVVYTFKATAAAPYEVTIGGSRLATLTNLAATINGENLLTPDAHPLVTAEANGDGTMTITARIPGTTGNGIATDAVGDHLSWDGATADGTGYSWHVLGVRVGEWIYVGGDGATAHFANNQGYGRVASISDTEIRLDKTTWAAEAEASTGISLQVFVGDFLYDEPDADAEVVHTYQFERTLGNDADGIQAEYIVGAHANEVTFNIPVTDKLTVDLGFLAMDSETRTGAEGRKTGTRVAAPNEDYYNTSSDIVRVRMSVLDDTDSFPETLFAYITEGSLSINNGLTATKAVGVFGALDFSTGNFTVSGEVTALFSSVLAQRAVRLAEDVTIDIICAADNRGFVFDIPLLGLGNGAAEVTLNDPITIPLEMQAGENAAGYTLSYTTFNYLPTVAMPETSA